MSLEKKSQIFQDDALISKSHQQSSFRAVKNLVQAQNNIETVKNRIKVLQMNQQRNINKINLQKALIQKITQTRNHHQNQLKKMGVNKKQRERIKQQIRMKNQQFRNDRKQKMNCIKEQIQQQKYQQYSMIKQQSQLHDSLIFQNKMSSLHSNQQRRNTVAQNEEKSKQNIVKFYDQKTKSIYQKNLKQIKKINHSRLNKQKKLSQYATIQMQLLQRNSQSQTAYKQMKTKLDTMLGKIRNDKRKGVKQMKSSVYRDNKQNIYSLDSP